MIDGPLHAIGDGFFDRAGGHAAEIGQNLNGRRFKHRQNVDGNARQRHAADNENDEGENDDGVNVVDRGTDDIHEKPGGLDLRDSNFKDRAKPMPVDSDERRRAKQRNCEKLKKEKRGRRCFLTPLRQHFLPEGGNAANSKSNPRAKNADCVGLNVFAMFLPGVS